jgi:hypothetical protein
VASLTAEQRRRLAALLTRESEGEGMRHEPTPINLDAL